MMTSALCTLFKWLKVSNNVMLLVLLKCRPTRDVFYRNVIANYVVTITSATC